MKGIKLLAILMCLLTAFAVFAASSSAEEAIGPCEHDAETYWRWTRVEPTCTSVGYEKRYCTYENCNKTIEYIEIPAHNYKEVFVEENATCISEGSVVMFCSWCNSFKTVKVPKDLTNHRYGAWETVTESTCKDEGLQRRTCLREGCPDPIDTEVIPVDASKHEADENGWTTITEATCYAEGLEKSFCKVCQKEITRKIPVHFDYATNTTGYKLVRKAEAKCNAAGYERYQCLKCLDVVVIEIPIDTKKHDFTDESLWEYPEDATCQSTDAVIIKHCKNQRSHVIEESYTPDHDFSGEETIIEPYCEKVDGTSVLHEGQKITKCLHCDETKTEVIPAAHSFGEWVVVPGTCEVGGTASRTCNCEARSENNVPFAAGTHLNYDVLRERESTCEYKGWTEIYCKVCDQTLKLYHSALGHDPAGWAITVKATCQNSGLKEILCRRCNKSLDSEVIEQKSHANIVVKTGYDPTCEEPGLTDYYYCNMCFQGIAQEVIEPTGHHYVIQNTPEEGAVRICDVCYKYEIIDEDGNEFSCKCLCHNSNGLAKTVWKIVTFFCKLFNMMQVCDCGIAHY